VLGVGDAIPATITGAETPGAEAPFAG
jgi:hypothetical protein